MPDIAAIIQQGAANPWLYLPVAILLGALHALEPGHSKSLMAAFIIAIRGTYRQAILLGVFAAIGHTIIVWGLALLGLYLGDKFISEKAEPWLVFISGLMIMALALRLIWSIHHNAARHDHEHGDHSHDHHSHDHHGHEHGDEDAHAAAHAREIEKKFAGRKDVSAAEVMWFGFTGGLLPCPAAIAVLLVCLQLRQVTLGIGMVAAFSIGLAITLVLVGVAAAWGTRKAAQSWAGFDVWGRRAPYISGALVLTLGLIFTYRGLSSLLA